MKHAWLVALALSLLLPASADARKRCRTAEPAALELEEPSEDRWPHDSGSGWVHESGSDWVHAGDRAGWQHESAADGWVHQTDYGWWAALPEAGLSDADDGDLAEDVEEDCTVSKDRNECVVLANQLAYYRLRLGLAVEREDELWEGSLLATIERLEARGELYACPWVEPSLRVKVEKTLEAVAEAVGVAAQVAATLYRLGVF